MAGSPLLVTMLVATVAGTVSILAVRLLLGGSVDDSDEAVLGSGESAEVSFLA